MLRKSKILSLSLCFCLLFEQTGFAQVAGALDISGHIAAFRNSFTQDKFRPLHLRSLGYDNNQNNFRLLLDKGDLKNPKKPDLEVTTKTLLNYFFVGVTLPNDTFWVNLRPDSENNIIDSDLATTDVGKILLEADLQLKKDTAKFTSPETPKGKEYWDKLYQKAGELLGYENITIPTLTRPWIVPGEIIIRETKDNAYIYKATLKVMLEQDYLKDSATYNFDDPRLKTLNEYSSYLIRDLILPKLTKEINTSQRYAPLRQVYYSLILAQWFKSRFYGKGGLYSWLIDRRGLQGLTSKISWSKTAYFKAYQKSFKDGEYNIQQPVYTPYGQSVRSYFSGGLAFNNIPMPPVASSGVDSEITKGQTKVIAIFGNPEHSPSSPLGKTFPALADGGDLNDLSARNVIKVRGIFTEIEEASSPSGLPAEGPQSGASSVSPIATKPSDLAAERPQSGASSPVRKDEGESSKSEEEEKASLSLSERWNRFKGIFTRGRRKQGESIEEDVKDKAEYITDRQEWLPFPPSKQDIAQARRKAFWYSGPAQGFSGVDLEYFVHAQTRLAERLLSKDELNKVLAYLEIPKQKTESEDYQRIIEELAKGNFNKELFDLISGLSYKRQRLDIEITKQSGRARTQGVYEAIANSLDALGFNIGQFGKGVKQAIDWLGPSAEDRIDVFSRKKDSPAYQLSILQDEHGQNYIQIKQAPLEEFYRVAGQKIEHGTALKITVKDAIPLKESQLDEKHRDSQEAIVTGVKKRFPYVSSVRITTQMGDNEPEEINGFRAKEVIVPSGRPAYNLSDTKGRDIHVAVSGHTIKIVDNGMGMDAGAILRMFVPKEGSKHPQPLSGDEVKRESESRVTVVQDRTLAHRVSFSRNGEVVEAIDVPDDIHEDATVQGGLSLELGSLLDVPESRDNIKIPTEIREGEKSNFEAGLEYAIAKIIHHPHLSDIEKAKYINTIIVGLEGLIKGNENYAWTVKNIRAQAKEALAPIIANLKSQGYILLPHARQFKKIDPQGKKVIYLHENLFNWQGAQSLRELGGEIVRGVSLGGDEHLPLVAVPFRQESLENFRQFEREWHTWDEEYRALIIKTDRFIAIPKQAALNLIALAQKRAKIGRLNEAETKQLNLLLQVINILSAKEVATSYEVTKPRENLRLAPEAEIARSEGEIDSIAVNKFLNNPPIPATPSAISTSQIPQDANQKYVLLENGDLVEVETGRKVTGGKSMGQEITGWEVTKVKNLEPVKNGYYRVIMAITPDAPQELYELYVLIKLEGDALKTLLEIEREEGEILFSPDKRFAYAQRNDGTVGYAIFDLDTGRKYYLTIDFSTQENIIPLGTSYSNLQFSKDGKYLTYLERDGDGVQLVVIKIASAERELARKGPFKVYSVAQGIQRFNMKRDLGIEGDIEYSINPFANLLFVQAQDAGEMRLIALDDDDGAKIVIKGGGAHTLHTDSTGAYTAIISDTGEMLIYIHKAKKLLTKWDFEGKQITNVLTKWKDGQAFYEVMVEGGLVSQFDEDGRIISNPKHIEQDYFEEFLIDGTMRVFSNIAGKPKGLHGIHLVSPTAVDPLQRLDQQGAYKHPHFELFIDNSDPDKPVAIAPKTGEKYGYKGEIIYLSALSGSLDSYYEGQTYFAMTPHTLEVKLVGKAVVDSLPARFLVVLQGDKWYLQVLSEIKRIFVGISSQYSSVSFDGKYFVFVNPKTGDVAYLDPEKPDAPIFISSSKAPPQASVTLTNTKPQDAPHRFVIVQTGSGSYDIVDTQNNLSASSPVEKQIGKANRIERVNSNTFITYEPNGSFSIISYDDLGGKNVIKRGSTKEGIVSYNHRLIVIENALIEEGRYQYVLDVNTGRNYVMGVKEFSKQAYLSASGRFSVHEDAEGNLGYYDYEETKPTVKLISNVFFAREYLVHRDADVLLIKDANDKYTLYSLPLGKELISDVEHIEIDSSGMIAVVKTGDRLNFINLKTGRTDALMGARQIMLASAEGFMYVIETKGEDSNLIVYKKEDGRMYNNWSGGEHFQDILLPRFWESYDFEKKTIWDRERGGAPEGFQEIDMVKYQNATPTQPSQVLRLSGETMLWPDLIMIEEGQTILRNLETNQDFILKGNFITGKQQFNSLRGGKTWYIAKEDGTVSSIYAFGHFMTFYEFDSGVGFVNQSKTFILGKHGDSTYLINSDGDSIDISEQILPGFIPTDVNGEYFVLANPQTQEVKYLDPRLLSPAKEPQASEPRAEDIEKQQELLELWNEQVSVRRSGFIAQAQAVYQPFLKLIPEEFVPEIEQKIKGYIEKIYQEQEKEVLSRFQDVLAGKAQELKLEDSLPFDHFQQRMGQLIDHLPDYLRTATSQLSQENYGVEKEFYLQLFTNLFALTMNFEINLSGSSPATAQPVEGFFEALALGWRIESQAQLDAAPVIVQFIQSLKDSASQQIQIAELSDIVSFLAHFTSKDPLKNISILKEQLAKLFKLSQSARERYLVQLWAAFRSLSHIQLAIDYLDKPDGYYGLGEVVHYLAFLTDNRVEPVKKKQRFLPQGKNIKFPEDGVEISQIIKLEQQRQEPAEDNQVMPIDYLIDNVDSLPERSEAQEAEILKNAKVQRESGAWTAEIAQNSRDATLGKQGELIVDFYRQGNELGEEEYVEEASDNGTGALREVALIIPYSTKADAEQIEQTGYFGTGKYTIFEGVDRVEIITRNDKRAFMFTFTVIRDASGNPTAIKFTGIREINDERVRQGVTVRRIKKIENTIPELEQMLAQRSWKTFAGLSQNDNFKIYFIDYEGKRIPLSVQKEVLSETDFIAVKPRTREAKVVNFGRFRLISAKDMPLQIVDKAGLRVGEIKEEYLALIPAPLRRHIEELGIIIQIPLPLIRNRSAFEYESEYLPVIQKYVAIEFYRAIAYLTLTKTSPQFVFEGFPLDWETNDAYWRAINLADNAIAELAQQINEDRHKDISNNYLENLLVEKGKLDKEKKFVKLLLLLEAQTDKAKPESKTSLLLRRLAIQAQIDEESAKRQKELLEKAGMRVGDVPDVKDVPYYAAKVNMALGIAAAHEQLRHPEDYIVPAKTDSEHELIDLAQSIAKRFGIGQVLLVSNRASFAGAFIYYKNQNGESVPTMLINQQLAHLVGKPEGVSQDKAAETIIHELAHLLEEFMRSDTVLLAKDGYVAHLADFSHDAIGTFAEAMKYISAVTLVNRQLPSLEQERSSAGSPLAEEAASSAAQQIQAQTEPKRQAPVSSPLTLETEDPVKNPAGIGSSIRGPQSIPDKSDKGGIDLRALPIINQPINTAMLKLSDADLNRLNNINLDSEWVQIQNMLNAEIIPSSERIREYLLACSLSQGLGKEMDRVLGCIADIMRMQEDRVSDVDVELKDILVLLEAGKPESELGAGLAQIKISPQEPQLYIAAP